MKPDGWRGCEGGQCRGARVSRAALAAALPARQARRRHRHGRLATRHGMAAAWAQQPTYQVQFLLRPVRSNHPRKPACPGAEPGWVWGRGRGLPRALLSSGSRSGITRPASRLETWPTQSPTCAAWQQPGRHASLQPSALPFLPRRHTTLTARPQSSNCAGAPRGPCGGRPSSLTSAAPRASTPGADGPPPPHRTAFPRCCCKVREVRVGARVNDSRRVRAGAARLPSRCVVRRSGSTVRHPWAGPRLPRCGGSGGARHILRACRELALRTPAVRAACRQGHAARKAGQQGSPLKKLAGWPSGPRPHPPDRRRRCRSRQHWLKRQPAASQPAAAPAPPPPPASLPLLQPLPTLQFCAHPCRRGRPPRRGHLCRRARDPCRQASHPFRHARDPCRQASRAHRARQACRVPHVRRARSRHHLDCAPGWQPAGQAAARHASASQPPSLPAGFPGFGVLGGGGQWG